MDGVCHVPRVELLNFRARSIQQSAQASSASSAAPYTALGLTGAGQIITIADTGVDTSSCYFSDPTKGAVPPTPLTSPAFDLSYRKVVQYNFNGCGDQGDEYAGHGTHVSGTAVGTYSDVSSHLMMATGKSRFAPAYCHHYTFIFISSLLGSINNANITNGASPL